MQVHVLVVWRIMCSWQLFPVWRSHCGTRVVDMKDNFRSARTLKGGQVGDDGDGIKSAVPRHVLI